MGKLSPFEVQNAGTGRHPDGDGLYLLVSPNGTKSWVLRVQVNGKRRDFGLGAYGKKGKGVTLSEAREESARWRKVAKAGGNPSLQRKQERAQGKTFKEAALDFHTSTKGSWKNPKHADQWINTLTTYAFPKIGNMAADKIEAADIQSVLLPIWQSKAETARRVRQRIGTVLDYCQAKGWRRNDAPMRAVHTLMKAHKQPRKGNFPAMPYRDLPAFLAKLIAGKQTAGRLALQFAVHTAARSGEVRGATWAEIDLGSALWTIPGERMKMGVEHVVPLSASATALLKQAAALFPAHANSLVFPGLRRKPLSDMTLSKVLSVNGGAAYTVHGFRSSFRDFCAERGYSNDWAEAALAHAVPNRVEAAYRRTKYLEQRRGLMEIWSDFCASQRD